ncbi:hypothetical protein FRD01_09980 [Microvenator marinus]|uniref:Uncharacterized protein n=1 Tax=Microvenator marinus TaxID=2600177 RepID=A0A5B8XPS1_9DELT|nr:hypothetical protein [Microvenator marinus]QED27564.1 hypothetical protein FRD01_09980 [Microvenator marinus]
MKLRLLAACLCLGCIEPPPEQQTNTNNADTNNATVTTNNGTVAAPKQIGDACEANSDCASNLCLTPGTLGMPGGYCYAPCDTDTGCPAGAHCALTDARDNGICVRSCEDTCERPGFGCFDFDLDTKEECWPRGEGPAAVGQACTTTTDCAGGNGAICLDASVGYEGGYCSTRCIGPENCDSGVCLEDFCLANSCDGRQGYEEVNLGMQEACFPSATGTGEVGDVCQSRLDCAGGFQGTCLRLTLEVAFCTLDCTDSDSLCGDDFCGQIPNDPEGRKICIERCNTPEDCVGGLGCVQVTEDVKLCLPPNRD